MFMHAAAQSGIDYNDTGWQLSSATLLALAALPSAAVSGYMATCVVLSSCQSCCDAWTRRVQKWHLFMEACEVIHWGPIAKGPVAGYGTHPRWLASLTQGCCVVLR